MEEVARRAGGPEFPCFNGKQIHQRTTCIRYADDCVILHRTWEGIQRCKDAIQEWLKGMGLELKDAKTRFAHTLEAKEECHGNVGFDFLGFTIRPYPVGKYVSRKQYVTIIKPSKKSIERHYAELAAIIERRRAATIDEVIRTLNPTIIGWCNYVKTQVSKKAFQRLDDLLWHKMYQWAKRKHNTKTAAWILEKYFKPEGTRKHHKIMGKTHILRWHDNTRIERHIPLRVAASPYDGHWSYWGTRKGAYIGLDTTRGKLLKHQGGRCGYCRLFFTVEDKTEIHHEDGNHKNHRFSNLKLLHLICHDQVHGTKKYTHEHIHGKTYSRQERITEEPCAGKLASTVLETSQEG